MLDKKKETEDERKKNTIEGQFGTLSWEHTASVSWQ